jgi:hypothetical protein
MGTNRISDSLESVNQTAWEQRPLFSFSAFAICPTILVPFAWQQAAFCQAAYEQARATVEQPARLPHVSFSVN